MLNELPHVVDAAAQSKFNEGKPTCLDATRVDLLHRIETWANDAHGKYLFWLNGMAGTGKSTIARTVARRFDNQERLGASFFFSRDKEDLSTTSQLFSTIAYQLANFSPTFKRAISQAIQKERDITRLATSTQWKQLILQPLEACKFQHSIIIVIDALDECKDGAAVGDILRLLTQAKGLSNVRLRVCVTARPESHIRQSFDDLHESVYRVNLHDIDADNDISNFVRHELKEAQKERPSLDADWPGEESVKDLTQRANGLFIYAATACRFIGPRTSPRRVRQQRLSLILNAGGDRLGAKTSGRSSTQELDIMYTQIVTQSVAGDYDEDEKEMMTEDFRLIVGTLINLQEPLPAAAIGELCSVEVYRVNDTFRHLHSILAVPESQESPVRLLHFSFAEFLLDKRRCPDRFWIDDKEAHQYLFDSSIQHMRKSLRRNICSLHTPGALASELQSSSILQCLPAKIQYACRYWIQHFRRSESRLVDNCQVHKFLQKNLLHWLEALSLIGKTSEGVLAITSLESTVTVSNCRSVFKGISANM